MNGATSWFSDPVVWVLLFPALASSGLLIQMIASLFTCCGTFKLRGKSVILRWWMIPACSVVCALLWGLLAGWLLFF